MKRTPLTAARRGMAGFVIACGLVLAAACGKGQGGSPATNTAPATSAPAPEPTAAAAPDPTSVAVADDAGAAAEPSAAARAPGKCPDVAGPDRVVAFDWSKELGVDEPLAARLRGTSGTAVETRLLAAQVEAELRAACAAIAAELGNKGAFASAPVACQAAVDALKATRNKLGAGAKIAVHAHAPICPEAMDDERHCAQKCGGEEKLPDATCAGASAGRCPGACTGACEIRAPGPCDGVCLGACEAGFAGTCDGTCKGKCNGRDLKAGGECKGKCEGSCDAVGKGECKGRCVGGCRLHGSTCAGLCTGSCSVPVQDPKCLGAVKLSGASNECAAYCELRAVHRTTCGAAPVDVRVSGPKDATTTAYVGAIERHLPAVLKVVHELKGRADALNRAKAAVSDGVKAVTASGAPALPSLAPCLSGYDKAATNGVASLFEALRAASEVATAAKAR